jgi:diaminopimelate epimerase
VDFVKVEGLGNDFIVIEGEFPPRAADVVRWCERRRGVGADGVLQVRVLGPGRVGMRYWNADGGEAEMCGNGLRCVARLAVERGWVEGRELVVETPVGPHPAGVNDDGTVRALVGRPKTGRVDQLKVAGVRVFPLSVGNPHAVRFVPDVDDAPVALLGPAIEKDPLFPGGTNVEFVTVVAPEALRMRIWERGVGETAASGTGAAAAAFAAHLHKGTERDVVVTLPGGELRIELVGTEAWMTGPANVVFSGTLPAAP